MNTIFLSRRYSYRATIIKNLLIAKKEVCQVTRRAQSKGYIILIRVRFFLQLEGRNTKHTEGRKGIFVLEVTVNSHLGMTIKMQR